MRRIVHQDRHPMLSRPHDQNREEYRERIGPDNRHRPRTENHGPDVKRHPRTPQIGPSRIDFDRIARQICGSGSHTHKLRAGSRQVNLGG